jgi:hypothetical protein
MHRSHAVVRSTATLILCLPLVACFEDPISEHVHLSILNTGETVVTVIQEVLPSDRVFGNRELAARLLDTRDTISRSLDPWSTRIARVEPLAETIRFERADGELLRSIHSVVVDSFYVAAELLEGDGLTGRLDIADGERQLQIFSTGGSRATASQQQLVEERLALWSIHVADYLGSVVDLYRYLDVRPDRAPICFSHVFDIWDEEEGLVPLAEIEADLVASLKAAMEPVADALIVPDGEAYSLNELSRLVYDPFPVRLTVSVDGDVVASGGFNAAGGFFERPRVDVWNALLSLAGRWVVPDPVTAAVAPLPEELLPKPDPVRFASLPRSFGTAPTAIEVAREIEMGLVPADSLTLAWRSPLQFNGDDSSEPDWLAVIAATEAAVPD